MDNKEFKIIMGFHKENDSCRKIKHFFAEEMQNYLTPGNTVVAVNSTTDRMEFDDSVRGGMYNVGFVLEIMNGAPIGQGGIKAWRRDNPNMRIILVMEESRKGTGKAKGLFDIGYYDGIFFGNNVSFQSLVDLLEKGRTKEEAYKYYGLENYIEPEKKSKPAKEIKTQSNTSSDFSQLNISATNSPNSNNHRLKDDSDKNEVVHSEGMLLDMSTVGIEKRKIDTMSQLSLDTDFSGERDTVDEVYTVPEQGTVDEESESMLHESDGPAVYNEVASSPLPEEPNGNVFDGSFGNEAFDSNNDYEEDASALSFSDSDIGEKSEQYTEKKESHGLILANRTFVRKSFDEIMESKEALTKYFNSRTNEAYTNFDKDRKELSQREQMFVECYEQFTRQYDCVFKDAVTGAITREVVAERLYDVIQNQSATVETKNAIMDMFFAYTYGYDILQDLLEISDITEIHVLSRNIVRVKKGSVRYLAEMSFPGKGRYEGFCELLLLRNRDNLTFDGTTKTFTDSTYSDKYYLQVSLRSADFMTTNEPEIRIRKTPKSKRTLKSLCSHKKISKENAGYLTYAALENKGIIICGEPTCGKTTILNALMDYLPINKSAIAFQHQDELVPGVHPEISVIHPRVQSADNSGASIVQLAKEAIGGDAEYFIMGDIKGNEAEPSYQALLNGYIFWTCITCTNPKEALVQFAKYIQFSGSTSSYDEIMNILCDKIGTIVHMDDLSVSAVYRVCGYDENDGVIMKNIYELLGKDNDEERK